MYRLRGFFNITMMKWDETTKSYDSTNKIQFKSMMEWTLTTSQAKTNVAVGMNPRYCETKAPKTGTGTAVFATIPYADFQALIGAKLLETGEIAEDALYSNPSEWGVIISQADDKTQAEIIYYRVIFSAPTDGSVVSIKNDDSDTLNVSLVTQLESREVAQSDGYYAYYYDAIRSTEIDATKFAANKGKINFETTTEEVPA